MAIFDVFAQQRRAMTNSEVARLVGIAETSCLDLLHTLAENGFLMRTLRSRRFYPTGRLLALASQIAECDPVIAVASEAVEALCESTEETALGGRLDGSGSIRVIAFCEGRHNLRYVQRVGTRISSHASALGKVLLAQLDPQALGAQLGSRPLRRLTPYTITSLKVLERVLEGIRMQGWAEVQGEGTEGVSAYAVAGTIGAEPIAIALAGPTDRFQRNRESYLRALKEVQAAAFGRHDG